MEENKKLKSRFVGVSFFGGVEQFAKQLEEEMNKLEDDGYAAQIIQFPNRADVVLFGRLMPPDPFAALQQTLAASAAPVEGFPPYSFKDRRTKQFLSTFIQVINDKKIEEGEGFSREAERFTANRVVLDAQGLREVAKDLEDCAAHHEAHCKDKNCTDYSKCVRALSAAFHESARIATS